MVAISKPRNAQEAIAQANRLQRARQILDEGYSFTQEHEMVAVCKPGELHASYWIGEHIDGTTGCDCADKAKTGHPCKHEYAWELLQAERADEAKMWESICARYDEEEGWAEVKAPTPTTVQFLEALQARLLADLNMARERYERPSWKSYTDYGLEANRLENALHVIGQYWNRELVGRLNLLPADKAEL